MFGVGLQFHLETTADVAQGMVENSGEELVAGSYVQSATEILDVPAARYQAINALMSDVLELQDVSVVREGRCYDTNTGSIMSAPGVGTCCDGCAAESRLSVLGPP